MGVIKIKMSSTTIEEGDWVLLGRLFSLALEGLLLPDPEPIVGTDPRGNAGGSGALGTRAGSEVGLGDEARVDWVVGLGGNNVGEAGLVPFGALAP